MSPRGQPGGWPVLAVLTAVLMFSIIELVVRHLLERYPLHQVVWLRSAAAIPVLALTLWALSRRASAAAPNAAVMPWHQRWLLHLLRSGLGTLSMACIFYAVGQIPLGTAAALTATAPFFVLLMSPYLLGEPVPWQRWAGVAVGFLGVCLVSGPQGVDAWPGMVSALLGAMCSAALMVLLRYLAQREPTTQTALFNALGITAWSTLGWWLWGFTPLQVQDAVWVLLMGVLGGGAHWIATWAYQRGQAGALAPLGFSACIWGLLLGYLSFGETPSALAVLGTATIIAGGYVATCANPPH
ncbi:MAG: DMT family transporter [Hydrogenophaga sp.]